MKINFKSGIILEMKIEEFKNMTYQEVGELAKFVKEL